MQNTIFAFSFPVTLTVRPRPQICSPNYSYSATVYFHLIRSFHGFQKTKARERRMDGQTDVHADGVQRLMRPAMEGRVTKYIDPLVETISARP